MRPLVIAAALLPGLAAVASAASPYDRSAQRRVIEDEFVVLDPTVAGKSKWLLGVSVDSWLTDRDEISDDAASKRYSRNNITGTMWGGGIVIGYDDWTLQYARRKGRLTGKTQRFFAGGEYQTADVGIQSEDEVSLRYLYRMDRFYSPYFMVGYNRISLSQSIDITTPNTFFTGGITHDAKVMIHSSPLVGIGIVATFNKYFGARADIRFLYSSYRYWDSTYGAAAGHGSGRGTGNAFTATAYVNLIQGLNLQVGGKRQQLPGPGSSRDTYGVFATLGYSFRF